MLKLEIENAHPRDANILFEEKEHKYYLRGKQVGTSVTSLIHAFAPPFDAEKMADKIASKKCSLQSRKKYENMTKEMILDKWKADGESSSSLGTALHRDIELYFNGVPNNNCSVEYSYFESFLKSGLLDNLTAYRTEWSVYDEDLDLAGQIDMLFYDSSADSFVIYDWKRSKEISFTNKFKDDKYLYEPLGNLDNCNFSTYSLQLNIYRYILQKNYGITVSGMYLLILHPNYSEYYRIQVPVLEEEIGKMVDWRKKEIEDKKHSEFKL